MSYNTSYRERNPELIRVEPSALKHGLTEDEVIYAWGNLLEYRRCKRDKYPPHYLALGMLPNGRTVEMVAFSTGFEWVVFHAMTPPTPGFMHEYKGASK